MANKIIGNNRKHRNSYNQYSKNPHISNNIFSTGDNQFCCNFVVNNPIDGRV